VLLGDADGGFTGPTNFATGGFPTSVATGDFNRDGDPDLAVANAYAAPPNVLVLRGDGTGSFTAAASVPAGSFPTSVVVGDFNQDADPDLAVAEQSPGQVRVLLGGAGDSFRHRDQGPARHRRRRPVELGGGGRLQPRR
jgi:hypothetical protein